MTGVDAVQPIVAALLTPGVTTMPEIVGGAVCNVVKEYIVEEPTLPDAPADCATK
jgi:hypothetical protein